MTLQEIKALDEKTTAALKNYGRQEYMLDFDADRLRDKCDDAKLSAWPAVVALLEEAREVIEDRVEARRQPHQPGYAKTWTRIANALLARIDGDLK